MATAPLFAHLATRVVHSPRTGRLLYRVNCLPPSTCDVAALSPAARRAFRELDVAAAVRSFVRGSAEARALRDWPVFSPMYLGRVAMRVLDKDGTRVVLSELDPKLPRGAALLDVGAGPGDTTLQFSPHFASLAALEPSPHCRRLLRARGIDAHGDARGLAGRVFDVVSLQNVLDRCADPRALLEFAAAALQDGPSRLWVALRLPVDAYQLNWDGSVAPQAAPLPADLAGAETWEASASAAVDFLEDATGLELERLSRVPYVTIARRRPGELLDSLDDALFVLRRRSA